MQADPFQANRELERELCLYTGAPYAVVVNSCTMALLLAMSWERNLVGAAPGQLGISLPKLTYVGVAMAAKLAGFELAFRDEDWQGEYRLDPLPVWDAARRFTKDMYQQRLRTTDYGSIFQCVSFHISKICGHSQGGAILHGDARADRWLRRARFDGRTEGVPPTEDTFDMLGWHCYLSPDVAAALRWKLASLPAHNADLPRDNYADLSLAPIFSGETPA
jgi:dTDP-4-amino-4,6-dideoxygalactose transaminase